MPDTGAPWNIPYAAPADLVKDWPALSEDIAEAVADGLDAAGNAGIGSNVVSERRTTTYASSASTYTSFLDATITPSSATAKILVVAFAPWSSTNNTTNEYISIFRDSTNLSNPSSPGSRVAGLDTALDSPDNFEINNFSATLLDSPTTASPVTYSIRAFSSGGSGTFYVNRHIGDANDATTGFRGISTLTLIEVAA